MCVCVGRGFGSLVLWASFVLGFCRFCCCFYVCKHYPNVVCIFDLSLSVAWFSVMLWPGLLQYCAWFSVMLTGPGSLSCCVVQWHAVPGSVSC